MRKVVLPTTPPGMLPPPGLPKERRDFRSARRTLTGALLAWPADEERKFAPGENRMIEDILNDSLAPGQTPGRLRRFIGWFHRTTQGGYSGEFEVASFIRYFRSQRIQYPSEKTIAMKSKKPETIPPGRYTDKHLEILQRLYLYTWFCEGEGIGPETCETISLADTDIEPMQRIRRNCIVDLLRDGFLVPPDGINTRGVKLYQISDHILDFMVDPEEAVGELQLGNKFDPTLFNSISLGRIQSFFHGIMAGNAELSWDVFNNLRFAKIVLTPEKNDVNSSLQLGDVVTENSTEKIMLV